MDAACFQLEWQYRQHARIDQNPDQSDHKIFSDAHRFVVEKDIYSVGIACLLIVAQVIQNYRLQYSSVLLYSVVLLSTVQYYSTVRYYSTV